MVGQRLRTHVMEFLWVQWYQVDSRYKSSFFARRLHRVELLPESDPASFGFIDPDDVIRGAHLIPAFAHGMQPGNPALYKYYYVNS